MNKDIYQDSRFSEIFYEAMESLPAQLFGIYHLHLLGWMNRDIAEDIEIPMGKVSAMLYSARGYVKGIIQRNYNYSSEEIHQGILALQKQDLELFSQTILSKHPGGDIEKKISLRADQSKTAERLGEVKDTCIYAAQMKRNPFRMAQLFDSVFSDEWKRELQEQLEEYEAAQEGLRKSTQTGVDFDALWEQALANSEQDISKIGAMPEAHEKSVINIMDHLDNDSHAVLELTARDPNYEKEIQDNMRREFANRTIDFKVYKGRILYRDMKSVFLVFEKGDDITTELDGNIVDLYVEGKGRTTQKIEDGSVIVDFDELDIKIGDYARVRYTIRNGEKTIDGGWLVYE